MKIAPGELTRMEAYQLMMSAIVPRPIAFVSTIGENGVYNLAPYSSFSSAGVKPVFVLFQVGLKRDGQKKDTLLNIEFSKEFVINVVTENLAEAMNRTAAEFPPDVDEFKEAGLTAVPGDLVKAPRVAESPVSMECKLFQVLQLAPSPDSGHLIIGQVVLIHASDELWTGKEIDITRLRSIGRLGGQLYCKVNDIFEMKRP